MYSYILKLEQTNNCKHSGNFLDVNIKLNDDNLETQLYNKTDDYNFRICRFPHNDSNIHVKIANNTLEGEMIRYLRSCPKLDDFILRFGSMLNEFKLNQHSPLFIKKQALKLTLN